MKQHGANLNKDYIINKIKDYNIDHYQEKLKDMINRLDNIVRGKAFMDEMTRFLPEDVQERTLKKSKFLDFLINEDKELLLAVNEMLR